MYSLSKEGGGGEDYDAFTLPVELTCRREKQAFGEQGITERN